MGSPAKRKATQDLTRYERSTAKKKKEELSEIAEALKTQTEPESDEDDEEESSKPEIDSDASREDILKECQRLMEENSLLKKSTDKYMCLSQESFEGDNAKVKFYTGLPNFATLMAIISHVSAHVIPGPRATTSFFDQILMVLIKLRLSLADQDIAY